MNNLGNALRGLLCGLLACGALTAGVRESRAADGKEPAYDVVVYGGTSGGVIAAVQTARMGKTVVLIEPGRHLGGLTTAGLGWTDSGNKAVIGGASREFYRRIRKEYERPEAWVHESAEKNVQFRTGADAMWTFEPKVAEKVMNDLVREAKVPVVLGERIDLRSGKGVRKEGARLTAIVMESGRTFAGKRFVDATYEGDLLAQAGASWTVGREPNAKYGETLDGVQKARSVSHQFVKAVDPYVVKGDPASGLLPGIERDATKDGEGDARIQAYNHRVCMTDVPANRVPFDKPAGYVERDHELLLRNFEAGDLRIPLKIDMMPNRKTDLNNNFAVSTDWIGRNHAYPTADHATRAKILADQETYIRGFLWTLANHPRVPQEIRDKVSKWGYAKDEFTDTGHFPHGAYVREARRLVGEYVQTENDCRRRRVCEDSIGLGSYNMDSHNVRRYVDSEGHVRNEGDIQVSPGGPYLVSYRAICPQRGECTNLLVPVCLSSSHIAYGSIRMEPVFMVLGQSAATAAVLSLEGDRDVQQVPYAKLRERLLADGQVLDLPGNFPAVEAQGIDASKLAGIVIDDGAAEKTGAWLPSSSQGKFVGIGYVHDEAMDRGSKQIRFPVRVPTTGTYEVRLAYSAFGNRAPAVPVRIVHAEGESTTTVDQRRSPPIDGLFVSLGRFRFATGDAKQSVTIGNAGATGHVIADAVQLLAE